MANRTVNVVYSKKSKRLIYKDIVIIKGGYDLKPEIASQILHCLPSKRLVCGKEYCLHIYRDKNPNIYTIYVVHVSK